jgi:hypothetical protein
MEIQNLLQIRSETLFPHIYKLITRLPQIHFPLRDFVSRTTFKNLDKRIFGNFMPDTEHQIKKSVIRVRLNSQTK